MKNIHILPTEKPSRLIIYSTLLNEFRLLNEPIEDWKHKRHIYITSDEEIKEGDWCFYVNSIYKVLRINSNNRPIIKMSDGTFEISYYKKIILTTDQDLIKDGVQAIGDEFLEWFVKNPSCEEVEVKKEYITPLGDIVETCYDNERLNYKIIIPSEKPKQEIPQLGTKEFNDLASAYFGGKPKQETLEEVELAILFHNTYEKLAPSFGYETREDTKYFDITTPNGKLMIAVCKEIIKWQQERMYSEEEVKEILTKCTSKLTESKLRWFELFGKK